MYSIFSLTNYYCILLISSSLTLLPFIFLFILLDEGGNIQFFFELISHISVHEFAKKNISFTPFGISDVQFKILLLFYKVGFLRHSKNLISTFDSDYHLSSDYQISFDRLIIF
jgi:hypothetical protein